MKIRAIKILKITVSLALMLALCLSFASCRNKKLYSSLEGMWWTDDASIILKFTTTDGGRYLSVIDDSLEVEGVTGLYVVDDGALVMNSSKAEYLGGKSGAVSIPYLYNEDSDTLTVEYLGKKVVLKRWTLDLDVYPTFPEDSGTSEPAATE